MIIDDDPFWIRVVDKGGGGGEIHRATRGRSLHQWPLCLSVVRWLLISSRAPASNRAGWSASGQRGACVVGGKVWEFGKVAALDPGNSQASYIVACRLGNMKLFFSIQLSMKR